MRKYKFVRFEVELIEPTGRPVSNYHGDQDDFNEMLAEIDHNEELTLFWNMCESDACKLCEQNRNNVRRVAITYDNGHEAPEFTEYFIDDEDGNRYADHYARHTPEWCQKIFGLY